MRVLLIKSGGVFWCEDQLHKQSGYGDTENTLGIMRYLRDHHDTMFLGQWRGTLMNGVIGVEPDMRGMKYTAGDRQVELAEETLKIVEKFNPEVVLDVVGPPWTRSWVNNSDGVVCQDCSVRHAGVPLFVINALGLPRIVIVTDFRNYPKNIEFTNDFPLAIPAAILGQENKEWRCTIGGVKHDCVAVNARAETWFDYGNEWELPSKLANGPMLAVAHSHQDSSSYPRWIREAKYDVWRYIWGTYPQLEITGRGWDDWECAHFKWAGPAAWAELSTRFGGPLIPPTPTFGTSKLRKYLRAGSCPFIWDGDCLRYDGAYQFVPKDSPLRFEDLAAAGRREPSVLLDSMHAAKAATEPDFAVLEACMAKPVGYGGYSAVLDR